jgi:hypothetical protein
LTNRATGSSQLKKQKMLHFFSKSLQKIQETEEKKEEQTVERQELSAHPSQHLAVNETAKSSA